ncbi:OSTN [Vulpes lagopus]
MLDWRLANAHFILAMTLMLWSSGKVHSVDIATEAFDSGVIDVQLPPTVREEKSATNLAAKLLLLNELVSLENDVIETKKKRSFSGFGSPLDRLSAGSVDHKGKQSESNRSSKKAIWCSCGSDWWKPSLKFQGLIPNTQLPRGEHHRNMEDASVKFFALLNDKTSKELTFCKSFPQFELQSITSKYCYNFN